MAWNGSDKFRVNNLREARYLSACFRFHTSPQQDWVSISLPEKESDAVAECKRQISQVLSQQNGQQFMTGLFNNMHRDLIPKSCFDWVAERGDRAVYFVEHSLKRKVRVHPICQLKGMDFIYAYHDLAQLINQGFRQAGQPILQIPVEQQQKELALEDLKNQFEAKPDLSWIEKMSEDQLKWASNYIKKSPIDRFDFSYISFSPPADNASSKAIKEYVFCALDQPNVSHEAMQHFLGKMSSAFSSMKNRQKGKTLNLSVSAETVNQLDEIVKEKGTSKAKVVEWLIRQEYKSM